VISRTTAVIQLITIQPTEQIERQQAPKVPISSEVAAAEMAMAQAMVLSAAPATEMAMAMELEMAEAQEKEEYVKIMSICQVIKTTLTAALVLKCRLMPKDKLLALERLNL
jgi:hypothetical protein